MPARHPDADAMTPNQLAQATAAALLENDACSRWLGLRLEQVGPGYARMSMAIRPEFLNGHQICHGGLIFTLADSAFAFACNTYDINTVASGCTIEFLLPVKGGDELSAEAVEQVLSGRHGIYDIRITNLAGQTVAMFRGRSAQIKGRVLPADS